MIKYIVSIVYPTTSKNSSWASYNRVDINVVAIDFMDAEKKALIKFSSMYPNLKGKVMSVNTNEGKFLDNITFKNGGTMSSDNKDMLMNQAKELKHHADELMKVLKDTKDVEAWVVAKAERATTDLSDITHYLDGEEGKYAYGGYMADGGTIYVDLFEYRDEMPYKVKVIVDKYEDEYGEDISYKSLLDMQREVENVGYTFDFGLDSMPYGLRPIGVDITQLRDYDDDDYHADGGMMAMGGATFSDKVKSISKRLDKTKVPLKYRKEYGKYFDKKEATESAQRIVGAMTKKEK